MHSVHRLLLLALALLGVFGGCAKATNRTGPGDTAPNDETGMTCGDAVCELDEDCDNCPDDCGACTSAESCGDGECGPVEDCGSCPADCGPCGVSSATVGAGGSAPSTSATSGAGGYGTGGGGPGSGGGSPAPVCGDAFCDAGETPQSCPQDCQAAGGSCDHDVCAEGTPLDPACDLCVDLVCAIDDYCCTSSWDSLCVGSADFFCGCG
jgi:hypothetical protein